MDNCKITGNIITAGFGSFNLESFMETESESNERTKSEIVPDGSSTRKLQKRNCKGLKTHTHTCEGKHSPITGV